jgi:hypothetical protein
VLFDVLQKYKKTYTLMKQYLLLFAVLMCAQIATAVDSKFIDDAPKGFVHITGESYGVETHNYLRVNNIVRLEQFSEENDGKLRHYIRLHTTATVGQIGGSSGEGKGELRQQFFQVECATKEEADKNRMRILELLSAKE